MSTVVGMGAEKKDAKGNESKLRKEIKDLTAENEELKAKITELESKK